MKCTFLNNNQHLATKKSLCFSWKWLKYVMIATEVKYCIYFEKEKRLNCNNAKYWWQHGGSVRLRCIVFFGEWNGHTESCSQCSYYRFILLSFPRRYLHGMLFYFWLCYARLGGRTSVTLLISLCISFMIKTVGGTKILSASKWRCVLLAC